MLKYLFSILTFLSLESKGQTKKDNTILISEKVTLAKIKSVFFANGYSLESNSDTLYLSTQSKELNNQSIAIKLLIAKTDSVTYIKGQWKPTLSLSIGGVKTENDFSQLDFSGSKNSPYRKAWNEMVRLATLLSDKISYIKQ